MSGLRTMLAAPLALAALALGCTAEQPAKISVLLKDAPADVTAAVVTISEIDLVGSGGTIVLSSTKTTTNLLSLANDTATLVDGFEVPTGTYSQLRFVITGGYVEAGGVIYASSPDYEGLPTEATVGGVLRMPSYGQSGLKIDLPGSVGTLDTAGRIILVDFDVSQSFGHAAGASGAWVMHPVCKATDLKLAGRIDVDVSLGAGVTLPTTPTPVTLANFNAVLTPAGGGASTTLPLVAAGGGSFTASFDFLFPGDYTLTLVPPGALVIGTTPPVPLAVTVGSGQVVPVSLVVSSAH